MTEYVNNRKGGGPAHTLLNFIWGNDLDQRRVQSEEITTTH